MTACSIGPPTTHRRHPYAATGYESSKEYVVSTPAVFLTYQDDPSTQARHINVHIALSSDEGGPSGGHM